MTPGGPVAPTYSFRDAWSVPAPVGAVHEVLVDLAGYPAWWPQVVAVAALGDDAARVLCRSALPYTLDLVLRAQRREPTLLETSVHGDLTGAARWRLLSGADRTGLVFEQEVRLTRPLLAALSTVARPLMAWNHARMMAGARSGLAAHLALTGESGRRSSGPRGARYGGAPAVCDADATDLTGGPGP